MSRVSIQYVRLQTLVSLVNEHRANCDGKVCNISLLLLKPIAENLAATSNKQSKEAWDLVEKTKWY